MASNVVVPLTVLAAGGALVYVGITNPAGGGFAGLGRALRGDPPVKGGAKASTFAATAADLAAFAGSVSPLGVGGGRGQGGGTSAASGLRGRVVAEAGEWLGVPYRWGGNTRAGVDCSGLTVAVYKTVGVNLPRVSAAQQQTGIRRTRATAQPGDLVFFGFPAHHVGIYLGANAIRHAPHTGAVVRDEAIWSGEVVTFRDVLSTRRKPRKRRKPPKVVST